MLTERKEKLTAINGWKVLLLLLVFFHHAQDSFAEIDFISRAMEFFFLSSGFLVAYNHLDSACVISISYFRKKLHTIYPLYFFVTLIYFFVIHGYLLTKYSATLLGINLLMLQTWSSEIYYSVNGAGWFACDLMICYAVSQLLLRIIKLYEKKSIILFIVVFFVRQLTESVTLLFPDSFFKVYYYVYPIGRVLEFALGMLLYPVFSQVNRNEYLKKNYKLLWTIIEILFIIVFVYLCREEQDKWTSAQFVLPLCIGLFIFAEGKGYISKLLSCKPLILAGKIQYEFYMLHALILDLFRQYFERYFTHGKTLICFIATVLFSFLYTRFLKERIGKAMNGAELRVENLLKT